VTVTKFDVKEVPPRLKSMDYRSKSMDYRSKSMDYKLKSMDYRSKSMDYKFKSMDYKSKSMDYKFKSMDYKFKSMDYKFKSMDYKFKSVDYKFKSVDYKFKSVDFTAEKELYMAKSNDWLPGSRTEILAMAQDQIAYMTPERRAAWGIPAAKFVEYDDAVTAAQEALEKVMNVPERNHVLTVQCAEAFDILQGVMRFFKGHYFLMPPLTKTDWAELGFRERDETQTPVPAPSDAPAVSPSYAGPPRVLQANLGPMPGTPVLDSESDYGYALYVGVMPPGGATLEQAASVKHYLREAPADGESLRHYTFTRRKKELVTFDGGESGMTAFFCARYENQKGQKGNWGPVSSAVIP
jgi:hypothetical protein